MLYFAHGFVIDHITICDCCYLLSFLKYRSKEKSLCCWQYKNGEKKIRKVKIKNPMYYYFDDIIEIEEFMFDNILLDEKPYENILIYDIS